jgi:maltooligosyltrehalose trehalohydrolase
MKTQPVSADRRLPVGAEILARGHASFRVWAPDRRRVIAVVDGKAIELAAESDGYHAADSTASAGSRYGFLLDDDPKLYPDPASRFQPDGPHGLSEIVDAAAYVWQDAVWPGLPPRGHVLYELHVGTFTREGSWHAAAERLASLRDLGVTIVQVMPVSDFPGRFGWGYDGVCWFAPTRLYGRPDDFRRFVDRAHGLGLGVTLDVVYNHVGPDGNYLGAFSRQYFTDRYDNEWSEALNFDGPGSHGMRTHVLSNVRYWIEEFHLDGLRLDATQQIFDASDDHIVAALARTAREAAGARRVFLLAENEAQETRLVRAPELGGFGLDALYNDDYHHTARVRLTGAREAYYSDFRGTAEELLAAVRRGFLFQGQHYSWRQERRGTTAFDCPASTFVNFLENHDQVANSATGSRLSQLAHPGVLRALTALTLLTPGTPLLFQGQEVGAEAPFRFFADFPEPLAGQVAIGRRAFLSQFTRIDPTTVPDPSDTATFETSRLDWAVDSPRARQFLALHERLLRLRRELLRSERVHIDGATLSSDLLVLRFFETGTADRLLVVNLGPDADIAARAEPLVAPPRGREWAVEWSSEDVKYGGSGTPPLRPDRWLMPGYAAVLLTSYEASAPPPRASKADQ